MRGLRNLLLSAAVVGGMQSCGGGDGNKPVYVGEYCPESGCSEGIPPHRVASVANNPGDTCALEVTAYTVEVITGYKTGESTTRNLGATTLYLAPDSCELLEE